MSRNGNQWESPPDLPENNYVSSEIYTDEEIYKAELSNIFKKTWQLACHESEIAAVGDYRAVTVADTPLIVVRGDDEQVRCFLNVCSHRSSKVVYEAAGNAKRLVCPFHLWTYDTKGECVERPRACGYDAHGPEAGKMGLRQIRSEMRHGIVFVNLDDAAQSLSDYTGNSWDVIDEVLGSGPLEVFHHHRFVVEANWKQWHETNMELYHEWGHSVNRRTSIMAKGYFDRKWGMHPNGHGWLNPSADFVVNYANYKGWSNRDEKPLPGLLPNEYRILDLFPNTTIMMRSTNIRIDRSTPLGPNKTLVEYRGLGIKGESAEDRAMRQKHHNQFWGPFGRNLPEDILFVQAVSPNNQSQAAKFGIFSRYEDGKTQDDEIIRAYYRAWSRHMGISASAPKRRPRKVAVAASVKGG